MRRRVGDAWRRIPPVGRACALVALVNALAWSLITPPFEVPDENAHYAYVAQLAINHALPYDTGSNPTSPEEEMMLGAVGFYRAVGLRQDPVPFTQYQQSVIDQVAHHDGLSSTPTGQALTATNNPPLYYLAQVIPFELAPGGTVLNRLAFMRVLSALLSAVTVLFIFLFLRELLPGTPWAWTTGALAAAFQPLFGFISGGVNNDNALNLCAAALLFFIARGFRRGLSRGVAIGMGCALGLGLVSKLTMLGFVPAALLAMALLLMRSWRAPMVADAAVAVGASSGPLAPGSEATAEPAGAATEAAADPPRAPTAPDARARRSWRSVATLNDVRRGALRSAAIFATVAAAPVALYLVWDRLDTRRWSGVLGGGIGSVPGYAGAMFSFRQELSHIWQLFLPHLWMQPQFSYLPLWRTWFKGVFGTFGWLDYQFSSTVFSVILVVVLVVVALALGELFRNPRRLRAHLPELSVYVVFTVGLCIEIGVESYRTAIGTATVFEQPRYLLPLLALYSAFVGLAVRLPGRRWGPVLGAVLVVLAFGHTVFSQMLTVARYYA